MLPFPLDPVGLCCCCCGAGPGPGLAGLLFPNMNAQETQEILSTAAGWLREPGRACEDFFPTLKTDPTTAERRELGRTPTLLSKLLDWSSDQVQSATGTLCDFFPQTSRTRVRLGPPERPRGRAEFDIGQFALQIGTPARGVGQFTSRAQVLGAAEDAARRDPAIFVRAWDVETGETLFLRQGELR